jgi:WS/DGAT/MGAT family acyltransferase
VASYKSDRLSAQDNTFLIAETPNTHMHVAGVQIYSTGNLRTEDGGVDFDSIRKLTASVLPKIPRYRQKLRWPPLIQHPVWVDDPDFNLDYHMRHTSLPRPGSLGQLKRMAARIMSQQLDRSRPLWETWVVEGLEGDRFALISKIHHCVIDGASGVDLTQILLSLTPDYEIAEPARYLPRPGPSDAELLRDEIAFRAALPIKALRSYREFRRDTKDMRAELSQRAGAMRDLMGWAVRPSSETPINQPLGPHRRFEWLNQPLADVKAVRKAAGCSVNDVILTTVTGALREYLRVRHADPAALEFRVSAPVSVRREEEKGELGNRVSSWILRLPLDAPDPRSRLKAVHEETQRLKESKQALGVEMMMRVAEWTPPVLLSLGAQAASGPINSIVTNVPGPQFPLYLLGSELLEMYPVVPLMENMGLGFAIFSYNGKVLWGFNADYELVPDLPQIPKLIRRSFLEFATAYDVKIETGAHEVPEAD